MSYLAALDTLRNRALARVAQQLPVSWAADGRVYKAEPSGGERPGPWLVRDGCARWWAYFPRDWVERQLHAADMFGVSP